MLRFALFVTLAALAIWMVLAGPLAGPAQAMLQPSGRWLLALQAQFQTEMAQHLRGVHAGQSAAFWGLMAVCASYGFLHAAGPGHGKALLGAYGMARRVSALKLAGIGLLAALAQATVAVALILGLVGIAGMGRAGIEELDRGLLAGLSLAAIAGIGLWLVWRALHRLAAARRTPVHDHAHDHADDHDDEHAHRPDGHCASCGHAHLPPANAMLQATTPREVAALIAAVAVRPCSGALILLLLTWQMGVLGAGIAGAYAMALGTAGVTIAIALGLLLGRAGLLRAAGGLDARRALWIGGGIEAAAGLVLLLGVLSVVVALG
jgi:nickel/cobalt transporter (NicO) family protein